MRLAILVLNYNRHDLLPNCLKAIKGQQYNNFDVWLIENGSSDNSEKIARKTYPKIKIIRISKNAGFTGGYNYAFKYLEKRKKKYNYYLVISNDVICDNNLTVEFQRVLDNYPEISIFGPTIVNGNQIIEVCGGRLSLLTGRCPGNLHGTKYTKKDFVYKTLWACGAAFFINTKVLKTVNFFDDYFAYFEDIGLGWKITNQKGLILSGQNCKVLHLGSSTFKSTPSTFYLIEKNRIIAYWQNLSPAAFWLLIWLVIANRIACLLGLMIFKTFAWKYIKLGLLGIKDGILTKANYPRYNNSIIADLKSIAKAGRIVRYNLQEAGSGKK